MTMKTELDSVKDTLCTIYGGIDEDEKRLGVFYELVEELYESMDHRVLMDMGRVGVRHDGRNYFHPEIS